MIKNLVVGSFPKHRFLSAGLRHENETYRVAENFLLNRGVPRGTRITAEFVDGVLILIKDGNSFNL